MRRPLAMALALSVALIACTATTPEIPPVSKSPTSTGSPSETPKASAPKARWAIYSTGQELVLYDVKADSVRVVARGSGITQPRFLTAQEISFVQRSQTSSASILIRLNIRTNAQQNVFEDDEGIEVYGWSPDRTRVAYVARDDDGYPYVRIQTIVGTRARRSVVTLARALGREQSSDDQLAVRYDRSGERIAIVYTYADGVGEGDIPDERSQLQIRSATGSLLYAADHDAEPTMGVWSRNTRRFYFRTDAGPRAYDTRDGGIESVPGATQRWYNPWLSPNGRAIAYDTGQHDIGARIRVVNVRQGTAQTVGDAGRFHPIFATKRFVWAQALRRCSGGGCLYPVVPRAQVFRININNGNEKALAITSLQGADVWYE